MRFKGYGAIYNYKKKKLIVSFNTVDEYETNDPEEIRLLEASGYITERSGKIVEKEIVQKEDKAMTKPEIMESLDASGIDYNPRDKKEVLLTLLEG